MANVTKCAIKAIKFYKHVVQSVEKFILKCKPEYKVPGLYVIDSIVRQSRHQFGQEKDVFAPRFTKNVVATFQNLFKCPPDEKSKIVRVLNLWQMNGVFPTAVIQPLLDMAAETNTETLARAQQAVDAVVAAHTKHAHHSAEENKKANIPEPEDAIEPKENDDSELAAEPTAENILATQTDMLNTVTMLLQQTQQGGATSLTEQQAQLEQLQLLQQQLTLQTQLMQMPQQQTPLIDTNLLSQIQTLTNQLLNKTATSGLSEQKPPEPGFNKKLLDFDYGESDEEDDRAGKEKNNNLQGTVQNILSDSTLMQHIQQMSQNIQKAEPVRNEIDEEEKIRQKVLEQQQAEFDREINQTMSHQVPHIQPPMQQSLQQNLHEAPPQQPVHISQDPQFSAPATNFNDQTQNFNEMPPNFNEHSDFPPENQYHNNLDVDMRDQQEQSSQDHQEREHRDEERSSSRRKSSHRSRDRSRSRSPRRKRRSRSRSRDRRRRSRSRDRRRRSRSRDRDRDRGDKDRRERERERRRKGLPPIKDNCISVCTRTLWFGHLSKMTSEEELQNEIEKYGKVESINMIPPRGCAFVVMCRRKDGAKAVDRLKGVKINGSALKVAYAPGIGVKEAAYKDYWDVELGASYVPWEKLPQDLDALVEGGMVDDESLPSHLKGVQIGKSSEADVANEENKPPANEIVQHQPQLGMPQGMQQFRQTVPGMLPVVPQMMPPMMMAIPQGSVAPGPLGMPPVSIPPVTIHPSNLVPISVAQGATNTPIVNPVQPTPPSAPTLSQQAPSVTSAGNVSFPGSSLSFPAQPVNTSSVGSVPQMSPTVPPPRPGFPPGFQNFNPNMPPPNFRMPPPAFNSPRPPVVRPPFENQTATEERSGSPNFNGSGNEDDDDDDEPSEVSKETPMGAAPPVFPPPGPMNQRPMHPMNVMGMGMRGPNPGPGILPPPQGGPMPMVPEDSSDSPDKSENMNFMEQPNMGPLGMPRPRGPGPHPGFNGFGGMDPRGFPPGMPRFPMRPGFGERHRFPPNFHGGPPGPGFRGPPGMMMRPRFGDMRPMMDGRPPFGHIRPPIRGLMDDAPDEIPEDFDLDLRDRNEPEDQDDRDKDDRDKDDRDQDDRVRSNRDRDHRFRNRDRDRRDQDRDRDRDRGHRERRDRDRRDRDHRDWNHRDRDHRDRDYRNRNRDSDLRDRDQRDQNPPEIQADQDVDHREIADSDNRFAAEQENDSMGDIDSRKSEVQAVSKENTNTERRQRKKNRWTDNTDIVEQEPSINENNNNNNDTTDNTTDNTTDDIGVSEEPKTNGEKIEPLVQENPDILNQSEVVDGGSTPTEAEPPTT